MHALQISRGRLSGIIFLCLALYVIGWWWAFAHVDNRGYPALSCSFVLVVCPVVSIGCIVEMLRLKTESNWWLGLAVILLTPHLLGVIGAVWVFLAGLGILGG